MKTSRLKKEIPSPATIWVEEPGAMNDKAPVMASLLPTSYSFHPHTSG